MRIQRTNNLNFQAKIQKQNMRFDKTISFGGQNDFSEIQNRNIAELLDMTKFLNQPGKVGISQYKKILNENKAILRNCYKICYEEYDINTSVQSTARLAIALKKYYDKLYKKYTLVSIGTSPAFITQVMQNLGVNVIFLPISKLSQCDISTPNPLNKKYSTFASRYPNIKILMDYATKKGIANKNAGEIVLLDFTTTGTTLETMKKIIQQRGDIARYKIHKHSLIDDLDSICAISDEDDITYEEISDLSMDLYASRMERIANVPHFPFDENPYFSKMFGLFKPITAHKIFESFDNFSTPQGRAWALCSMHEAFKILSKKNPVNPD